MRILLTSEFFLSGQSTHLLDLAIQLKKFKHDVRLLLPRIHTSYFYDYYANILQKAQIPFYHTREPRKILQLATTFKPEIIHSHSSTIFNLTREIAIVAKCPYVVTCHGLGFSNPKYRLVLSSAQRIIAVGKNSKADIPDQYQKKSIIIPNGIDTTRFSPKAKEKQLIVYYIGRIDGSKVPALEQLHFQIQKIPHLKLEVIGNWQPPIKNINFQSWRPDLENVLKKANIVVSCGRTAREALASGCVVFLLNNKYDGVINEQITDLPDFDFSGRIGRYKFQQIGTDLAKLTNNRKKIKEIQKFSRKYAVANLSSEQMTREIIGIYQQALDAGV